MASGDCAEDRLNCAKIFSELKYWQEVTEKSEAEVRTALQWPPSQPLWMRMMFDNRSVCIYEATKAIRVAFKLPDVKHCHSISTPSDSAASSCLKVSESSMTPIPSMVRPSDFTSLGSSSSSKLSATSTAS